MKFNVEGVVYVRFHVSREVNAVDEEEAKNKVLQNLTDINPRDIDIADEYLTVVNLT